MRYSFLVLLFSLLVGCGGGSVAPTIPPQAPPVVAEPEQPVVLPPATPVVRPEWKPTYTFTWTEDTTFGGWVRHSGLQCNGSIVDPDKELEGVSSNVADWAFLGDVQGTIGIRDGFLHISSYQHTAGFAILSHKTWPTDKPLAITTMVSLEPDSYSWLGFTLIADETDYRELAVYERDGQLKVGVWKPCVVEYDVALVSKNTHTLRLEYTPPPAETCWKHYVDNVLVSEERCDNPGAPLINKARVGIYVVNLLAEGQRIPGYVRAVVGPVVVEQQ